MNYAVLGVCSVRIFAKIMGDPHYEPTIVVHDSCTALYYAGRETSELKLAFNLDGLVVTTNHSPVNSEICSS